MVARVQLLNQSKLGFWQKSTNQRQFFDKLGKQLGYKELDDWYKVTLKDIYTHGGRRLLDEYYNTSPSEALKGVYPEHNWRMWRFGHAPKGFWEKNTNQRQFFDWLGKELGYKELDDWYKVTLKDIYKHGGQGLLPNYYNNSPSEALKAVYPEHNWMMWRFGQTPKGLWEDVRGEGIDQRRLLLDWLCEKLHIQHLDDWYRISLHQIQHILSVNLTRKTLAELLFSVYPEHNWDVGRLLTDTRVVQASQRRALLAAQGLFPTYSKRNCNPSDIIADMYEGYKHPQLVDTTGRPMELDIFIPDLSLAIEYQAEQHHISVVSFLASRAHSEGDKKKQACEKVKTQLRSILLTKLNRLESRLWRCRTGGIGGRRALQQPSVNFDRIFFLINRY